MSIFIKRQFFNLLEIGIRNLCALFHQSSGGNKLIGVLTVVACKQHFMKFRHHNRHLDRYPEISVAAKTCAQCLPGV